MTVQGRRHGSSPPAAPRGHHLAGSRHGSTTVLLRGVVHDAQLLSPAAYLLVCQVWDTLQARRCQDGGHRLQVGQRCTPAVMQVVCTPVQPVRDEPVVLVRLLLLVLLGLDVVLRDVLQHLVHCVLEHLAVCLLHGRTITQWVIVGISVGTACSWSWPHKHALLHDAEQAAQAGAIQKQADAGQHVRLVSGVLGACSNPPLHA
mmetsp:Transcript_40719/g.90535  ORF Transcript_40719/g.90535 Transcript_40719/m.90535 type:complete len:203 (+) Transcript_40719:672-1280(+)